jgi:hypothetical protein
MIKSVLTLFTAMILALALTACGSSSGSPTSPSSPSTPVPPTPPAATTYTLSGTVTVMNTSTPIAGAVIRVTDGPNAGTTATTDGTGRYSFNTLQRAGFSVAVEAAGYTNDARGINLTSNVTANFSLLPAVAWSNTGRGNTVFDMPTYIRRVRITADYGDRGSNFIVKIGGRLVVNELVGTRWNQPHYEGIHAVTGGAVEITDSSGIAWSFLEVR